MPQLFRRKARPNSTVSHNLPVAVGDDLGNWFLINASPDLPAQIAACPSLQPNSTRLRNTPIAGVLLTNADLDHTLGLLSLREGGRLRIYATKAVRETVDLCPGVTAIMEAFGGVAWEEPTDAFLRSLHGANGGREFKALADGCRATAPKFAKGISPGDGHSVAYQLVDARTGGKLLVAPDVAGLNEALQTAMVESDAVLFDGQYFGLATNCAKVQGPGRLGGLRWALHVTIKDCSLSFAGEPAGLMRKVYIHINNTNPMLTPGSPERAAVEAAGIVVGFDGLEFEL